MAITSVKVAALKAGTGAIRLNFVTGGVGTEGMCIEVTEKPNVVINSSGSLVSAETYNTTGNPAGLHKYEDLTGGVINLSGNNTLNIGPSNSTIDITIKIVGDDVSFASVGGVGSLGYEFPTDGDVIRLIGNGTALRLIKVGNDNIFAPPLIDSINTPVFDSLILHQGTNPNSDTVETLVFRPTWTGARGMRLSIGGQFVLVGAQSLNKSIIIRLRYTIPQATWNLIYGSGITSLTWSLQVDDGSGNWENAYSVQISIP